jgi:hypothetical protein
MSDQIALAELDARLKREVLLNSLEALFVAVGIIGLIFGLKYVVLACAIGRLVCGVTISPAKLAYLFACFVELTCVVAGAVLVYLLLAYLGEMPTAATSYLAWSDVYQIAAAFLIAGLVVNAMAVPGLYDAQREQAMREAARTAF